MVCEGISKIPFESKLHDSANLSWGHRAKCAREQPERPTQREILGAAKVRSYQIGLEELNAEPGQLQKMIPAGKSRPVDLRT